MSCKIHEKNFMLVWFDKEKKYTIVEDLTNKFSKSKKAKVLDAETNKWVLGEIVYRGKRSKCEKKAKAIDENAAYFTSDDTSCTSSDENAAESHINKASKKRKRSGYSILKTNYLPIKDNIHV
jgi:hypothetical protein